MVGVDAEIKHPLHAFVVAHHTAQAPGADQSLLTAKHLQMHLLAHQLRGAAAIPEAKIRHLPLQWRGPAVPVRLARHRQRRHSDRDSLARSRRPQPRRCQRRLGDVHPGGTDRIESPQLFRVIALAANGHQSQLAALRRQGLAAIRSAELIPASAAGLEAPQLIGLRLPARQSAMVVEHLPGTAVVQAEAIGAFGLQGPALLELFARPAEDHAAAVFRGQHLLAAA